MAIDLRHLRYLVAVAEAGSITVAARQLYITQPALSVALRELERERRRSPSRGTPDNRNAAVGALVEMARAVAHF